MLYGVSGASGVGKSTVCDLVSDSMDMTFLKTSITESARRHGFNAVGKMTLRSRIELQYNLLEDHIEAIERAARPIICDRTPIDMAAYLLGEIHMQSHEELTVEERTAAASYVTRCVDVASTYYDFVFHLVPLPFYEHAPSRPADNAAYQVHTDLIMRGMLGRVAADGLSCAILNTTDLDERQDFIHNTIVSRLDKMQKLRQAHPRIH